jgi:hypothetical protein
VALDEAAEIVRRAGKYGHKHSEDAFASYMGHQTTNSGAFKQRFAAMRSWGLITVEQGQVLLTELGGRIAHPVSDDDDRLALREAFMHAEVFAELYSEGAKGQQLETARLANRAVQNFGVSPKSSGKFAQCFAKSAIAAGLASEAAPGKIELLGDGSVPLPAPDQVPTSLERAERPASRAAAREVPSAERIVHQVWPARGGSIAFEVRLDRPLPAQAFSELGEIFQAVERLVGELGGHPTEADAGEE